LKTSDLRNSDNLTNTFDFCIIKIDEKDLGSKGEEREVLRLSRTREVLGREKKL